MHPYAHVPCECQHEGRRLSLLRTPCSASPDSLPTRLSICLFACLLALFVVFCDTCLSPLRVWCLEARQGSEAADRGTQAAVFAGLRCSQGRLPGDERSVGARAEGA